MRRNNRAFPTHLNALAILAPQQRLYSTEPSTSSNSGTPLPPPGFNAEQAKKPLPPSDGRKPSDSKSTTDSNASESVSDKAATSERIAAAGQSLKETALTEAGKRVAEKKEDTKKLSIGQKIKKEVQHYWDGTKLLATEVRISVKLAMKMAAGYELSRRENRQVSRFEPLRDLKRVTHYIVDSFNELSEILPG